MNDPDLPARIRRELHEAADSIEPAPGGLDKIQARTRPLPETEPEQDAEPYLDGPPFPGRVRLMVGMPVVAFRIVILLAVIGGLVVGILIGTHLCPG